MIASLFLFSGRATRRDYWRVNIVAGVLIGIIHGLTSDTVGNPSMAGGLGMLALAWPVLAVSVKRCHDRSKSGWWLLAGLIPYIGSLWLLVELGCLAGAAGGNRFGPDLRSRTESSGQPASDTSAEAKQKSSTANAPKRSRKSTPPPNKAHLPARSTMDHRSARLNPRAGSERRNPKTKKPDIASPDEGSYQRAAREGSVTGSRIQQMVAAAGPTLSVWPPQEFGGPLIIERPVELDFGHSTVWAIKGPVLTIKGAGVSIRNVHIEVTGGRDDDGESAIAIRVAARAKAQFENVSIWGLTRGIPGEDGVWALPKSIRLGSLAVGASHKFRMRLDVPSDCQLVVDDQDLTISPQSLGPGCNEVMLHLHRESPGPYSACIVATTPSFKRRVPLTAYFCKGDYDQDATTGQGQLIWPLDDNNGHRTDDGLETERLPEATPAAQLEPVTDQSLESELALGKPERRHQKAPHGSVPGRTRSVTIPAWARAAAGEDLPHEPVEENAPAEVEPRASGLEESQIAPSADPETTTPRKSVGRPGKAFGL